MSRMSVMLTVVGVLLFTAFLPVSSVPTNVSSFQLLKSQAEAYYTPPASDLLRGEEAPPKVSSQPLKFTPSLPVSPPEHELLSPPLEMPKPLNVSQSIPPVLKDKGLMIPTEKVKTGTDTNAAASVPVSQQESMKPENSAKALSLPSDKSTSDRTSLSSLINDVSNPQPQDKPKQANDSPVAGDDRVVNTSSPIADIVNKSTGVDKAPEVQNSVKQDIKGSPSLQQDQKKPEVAPVGNDKSTDPSDSDAGPKEESSKEAIQDKVTGSVPGNVKPGFLANEPMSPTTSKSVEMGVPRKDSVGKTVASSVVKGTATGKDVVNENSGEKPLYSQGITGEEESSSNVDNSNHGLLDTDFMDTRVGVQPEVPQVINGGKFSDDEDSHFFAYFLTIMVTAIIFYLVFHNKQRIIALIIEGRAPNTRGRRNSSRAKYHKLDNNLEEAMSVTKGTK